MGQYYMTVFLDTDETMCTHDYNNGLKLMEHSYVGNYYVNAVVSHLIELGECRMGHIGDYSRDGFREENDYTGLYAYELAWRDEKNEHAIRPQLTFTRGSIFIINEDKQEYIQVFPDHPGEDLVVSQFMLLIAKGNGLGGGDYHGSDEEWIGSWAFDLLRVSDTAPEGYEFIENNFKEEW